MPGKTTPTYRNPDTVAPPIGAYSHVALAPPGAQLIAFAGQVGNMPDGTVPPEPEKQFEQALRNILSLLQSEGAAPEHLMKLNTYLVQPMDLKALGAIRTSIFGEARPASTLVYVSRLAAPQYLVEVEAWAVKPA